MPKTTIEFAFNLGDHVTIKAIGRPGKVDSLAIGIGTAASYWVKYADLNGAMRKDNFDADELIPAGGQ